jgi:hypothetical protein
MIERVRPRSVRVSIALAATRPSIRAELTRQTTPAARPAADIGDVARPPLRGAAESYVVAHEAKGASVRESRSMKPAVASTPGHAEGGARAERRGVRVMRLTCPRTFPTWPTRTSHSCALTLRQEREQQAAVNAAWQTRARALARDSTQHSRSTQFHSKEQS